MNEAVDTFNHGCYKSASVMLGCASEQAVLILHETFESAIKPEQDKNNFKNKYNWPINSKFKALYIELKYMI